MKKPLMLLLILFLQGLSAYIEPGPSFSQKCCRSTFMLYIKHSHLAGTLKLQKVWSEDEDEDEDEDDKY